MGDCQNYGPFLGPYYDTGPNTGPNLGDPKRDHNFDNPPYIYIYVCVCTSPEIVSPKTEPKPNPAQCHIRGNLASLTAFCSGFVVCRVLGYHPTDGESNG